jgi:hypothetical protein
MRYVDAGYIIALSVLFVYALSLIVRRRRGERALLVAERDLEAPVPGVTVSGVPVPEGASGADEQLGSR